MDMITIDTRTEMSGTGHRYIGDSSTAALHIDNVRLEDDGIWDCTIESDERKIISGRSVKLIVLGRPILNYSVTAIIFTSYKTVALHSNEVHMAKGFPIRFG